MSKFSQNSSRKKQTRLASHVLLMAWSWCCIALVCTGCRSNRKQKPAPKRPPTCKRVKKANWPVQMFIRPTPKMNASPEGRPLDTQVQILQLRSLERLQDAAIRRLWNSTEEVLGPDLVSASRQTVRINRGVDLSLELRSGAKFLAVLAWLRNPSEDGFWSAVRLPLDYQIGACKSQLEELPAPCTFVSIGQHSISMGLEPQSGFSTSGLHATCPSTLLLHSFPNTRP